MRYLRFAPKFFILLAYGLFNVQPAIAQECNVRLGDSRLDFGQIPHLNSQTLNTPGAQQQVGSRFVSLNASCPTPSKLLLILHGDSLGEKFRFADRGQMKVSLTNALLDGRAVDLAQIKALGDAPRAPSSTIEASPGDLIVPVSAGLAAEGSRLSMQIEVVPQLPASEMSIRDSKMVEGQMSIEIRSY